MEKDDYKPRFEALKRFYRMVMGMPPMMRLFALDFPNVSESGDVACYKLCTDIGDGRGLVPRCHVRITGYSLKNANAEKQFILEVEHFGNSALPGIRQDVNPGHLRACGCGDVQKPTPEQRKKAWECVTTHMCGDPECAIEGIKEKYAKEEADTRAQFDVATVKPSGVLN